MGRMWIVAVVCHPCNALVYIKLTSLLSLLIILFIEVGIMSYFGVAD